MSGTCSVRTEKAGTSMSMSRPNASRADTLVSGRLISEVGLGGAMSTAVFIVQRFLFPFLQSLTLVAWGARGTGESSTRCSHPGLIAQTRAHGCIGKIDGLQPLFGVAAAAVGVGMVPFRQFLVAAFHHVQRDRPGQAERGQRLAQF